MEELKKVYKEKGQLHHAYLLIGDKENIQKSLINFLKKEVLFTTQGNPDFIQVAHETFGIDEARALKSITGMRAIEDRKFALISLNSITTEAQNSLLKIFEDPVGQTTFFVIASTLEIFIPTLLSRFFIVDTRRGNFENKNSDKITEKGQIDLAKNFLSSSPAGRISLLEDLIEKKDKIEAINFLNSLESLLATKLHKAGIDHKVVDACNEIIKYKGYLYDRASSIKMLLQHISCTIPVLEIKKPK